MVAECYVAVLLVVAAGRDRVVEATGTRSCRDRR